MNKYLKTYFNNFRGFSREIWVITLITFINRSGAMVMPFLTKYLHESFSFNLQEVGWLMSSIGAGSLFGNWIGGKLTDKIGFHVVILASLFLVGFGFLSLMFLYDFTEVCIGLFIVTAIADMYKPAMFVAINFFSNWNNRTRALTLVRLASNLGMVSGPVIAGILIANQNYDGIFWIDGLTCIVSVILFMFLIDEEKIEQLTLKNKETRVVNDLEKTSLFKDFNFIIFLSGSFITAFLFFQLFTTLPLYNSSKLNLSEIEVGMLLSLNGLIIFFFEMPIIGYLERIKINNLKIIQMGAICMSLGFFSLLLANLVLVLIVSIILITIGQILIFSFANTFALSRAKTGYEGRYMAFYAMSFSVAQMLSPKVGFNMIESFSYNYNWLLMGTLGIFGIILYFILDINLQSEKEITIKVK